MKKIHLKGIGDNGQVWLDGKFVDYHDSLKVRNHSETGFAWGYGGSGPSQLALAILLKLYSKDIALKNYMDFKFNHIAKLPCGKDFDTEIVFSIKEDTQV